jgi:hypothetical protein
MAGESTRTIEYQRPAAETLRAVEAAFGRIGKLLDSSDATMTTTGRTRYGLQSVNLRASVRPVTAGTSTVTVQASGVDIWGGAARKGTDRLVAALGG